MKNIIRNNLPARKLDVTTLKPLDLGDYFVVTPNRDPSVSQQEFDKFQQNFSSFITEARLKGYEVRAATTDDDCPLLSVIFERGKAKNRLESPGTKKLKRNEIVVY